MCYHCLAIFNEDYDKKKGGEDNGENKTADGLSTRDR